MLRDVGQVRYGLSRNLLCGATDVTQLKAAE